MSTKINPNKAEGVDLECVDEAILTKYIAQYRVAVSPDAPLRDRVIALAKAIKASVPPVKIADCDYCGGDSCINDPECPYCGVGGFEGPSIEDDVPMSTSGAITKPSVPAPAPKSTPKPAPAPKPAPMPKKRSEAADTKKAKKTIAMPTIIDAVIDEPGNNDFDAMPATAVVVAGQSTVADLVEEQGVKIEATSKITIDEAIHRVYEAKRLAVVSYWQLGMTILQCFANELWKQKRGNDRTPYKGFAQFVEAELQMSPQYAYKLMDIAATFSASDVAQIGVAKLGIVLKLPPATRERLLEDVRKGMPYSELAGKVSKLSDGAAPQRGQGKKDMSKATAAAAAIRSGTAIVTASVEAKRIKMPMFARGASKTDPKRAKRLADDPWGEFVTLNGITLRIAWSHDADGRLISIIEFKKPDGK